MLAKKYKELFSKMKYSKATDNFIGENLKITVLSEGVVFHTEKTLREFLKTTK